MPKGRKAPSKSDDQEDSEGERKAPQAPSGRRIKRSLSAPSKRLRGLPSPPGLDAPTRRLRRTKSAALAPRPEDRPTKRGTQGPPAPHQRHRGSVPRKSSAPERVPFKTRGPQRGPLPTRGPRPQPSQPRGPRQAPSDPKGRRQKFSAALKSPTQRKSLQIPKPPQVLPRRTKQAQSAP